ncbi:quorum-sensing sensor histidine kinase AgrC [Staphylococcus epidermidis]|uniref:quorum-sensing sensor histidine kinase AgrC n=1 Tax=Staphylococcus epidermidis TaxID=1282 RepID=UPI0001A9629E|nr:GHKL domain-containing protein [Staphylococcus epidermidis]AYY61067.1 GHKL domain-containing protein [Staphylococcus epidermidis]EES37062.1 ATPase/histidine kinase/DNA gyrase B/HSP90 domain protein [Staphylococcus epidermidis W23144]EJD90665.1 accessory protein regulator protein C [Staphylococcus epidermidis NIHLM061]EJE04861.1 accessory protein regulator protein C [Staphylococcus epidermidis NIHLM023]MBE7351138.1 GHKL domain-containing protein [Staphylococcus epidermidis]
MGKLDFLPFAAIQVFLLVWVTKTIANIKFVGKDYIFITGIIILSAILYNVYASQALVLVVLIIIIFFYSKVRWYSIVIVLMSTLLSYLTNFITVAISLYTENIIHNIYFYNIFHFSIFIILSLILAHLFKHLLIRLRYSYLYLSKRYYIIISFVLAIAFIYFYIISQTNLQESNSLNFYAIIFVSITVLLSLVILLLSAFALREMKYKRKLQEIEAYYEYTLRIESINNEMRKFRHDYVNILTTLSDYIREDDMPGLRKYFDEHIVPMKDKLKTRSIKMNGIEKLKVREIKGLITTKIIQAQEKRIPISIEVPDEIDRIDMNTVELSRIIGIIVDNAIEASENLEEPLINIAFIDNDESVTFIVMNKCSDDIPKIHELFEQGFSTKGDNRGLGLSTLKELTDSNENVLLDTVIENGYFVQKVEINNKES